MYFRLKFLLYAYAPASTLGEPAPQSLLPSNRMAFSFAVKTSRIQPAR